MAQSRIFVSYSHKDEEFTQRVVDDLHQADAEVWVDKAGITHGNFMQRIDEALQRCEWLVLILTPNAIASPYVRDEVYTALHRVNQGYMRGVIPILAALCAPGTIPPQWDVLQRYDATHEYGSGMSGVLRALGLSSAADAVPSPATAASKSTESADDLFARGKAMNQQKRYEEAIPYLERATQLAPGNMMFWLALAIDLRLVERHEAALSALEHAGSSPLVVFLKADSLHALGRWNEALAALDYVHSHDLAAVKTAVYWFLRGTVLAGLNRADEARSALERAVTLDVTGPSEWYAKAGAFRALGREAEAQEAERRSGELDK